MRTRDGNSWSCAQSERCHNRCQVAGIAYSLQRGAEERGSRLLAEGRPALYDDATIAELLQVRPCHVEGLVAPWHEHGQGANARGALAVVPQAPAIRLVNGRRAGSIAVQADQVGGHTLLAYHSERHRHLSDRARVDRQAAQGHEARGVSLAGCAEVARRLTEQLHELHVELAIMMRSPLRALLVVVDAVHRRHGLELALHAR
mmetsp:Transcript_55638/g.161211  ORF Transcript_55638/g.161211 Transcript_55638/m.161211 type:complete len:203 (+) Transcript_55638:285-893(+)